MNNTGGESEQDHFAELSEAQLETFARELTEMYRQERQLRKELEKEKSSLEQRLRELTALNQLFQQHLERRSETERVYFDLARGLQDLSDGIKISYHESALAAQDLLGNLDALMDHVRVNPPLSNEELKTESDELGTPPDETC